MSWARSNIASGACTGFIWLVSKKKYEQADASRVGCVIVLVSCDGAGAGVVVDDDDMSAILNISIAHETPSQFA